MSRLYGRVEDIYNFYKYLLDNYNEKYKKDKTIISYEELEDSPRKIFDYLGKDNINYINECNVKCYYDKLSKNIKYNIEDDNNILFFPSKKMQEEYKSELVFYIGALLNEKSLDYMENNYDICCQYSDLVPLLTQYLFFKENHQEERFVLKNFNDLKLNAPIYCKIRKRAISYPKIYTEDVLLRNTLLNLVPISSLDATFQIIDKYGNDKNKMRCLLGKLIENENHNREKIINEEGFNTYGFKRLRKEIDKRRIGDNNE